MPAGTTLFTKSIDRLATLANAYSGMQQVYKGYTRFAEAQNLDALIIAQTAEIQARFSVWLTSVEISDEDAPPFTAAGEMLIYLPKDTTTDCNLMWDFIVGFCQAIRDPDSYLAGEMWPDKVVPKLHQIDVTESGGIAIIDFGAYGGGGEITFVDP